MLLLLIFEGVRQRTVRQQSTMDNSGTMPIFVYGNTSQPEYDPIQQDDHDERQAAIPEHPDAIAPTDSADTVSRRGRTRKPKANADILFY